MATSLLTRHFFSDLPADHRTWLSDFDPRYLANWEKILAANEEAALAEAGVRQLLQGYSARVEPNEDLTGAEQRPRLSLPVEWEQLRGRSHPHFD